MGSYVDTWVKMDLIAQWAAQRRQHADFLWKLHVLKLPEHNKLKGIYYSWSRAYQSTAN